MATDRDKDQVGWDPQVLRAARDARGWSIAEAARQLRASSDQSLPGHDSLVKAWKRWEHGTEPSRFYRPLLVTLLDTPDPIRLSGIVEVFPRCALVPTSLWDELIRNARDEIWTLQYAGLFLPEQQPDWVEMLGAAADAGSRVRLVFGDPDSLAVMIRAAEEAIGTHSFAAEISDALDLHRDLADRPGVEVRRHTTVLHASAYRFDDEMLVLPYVHGLPLAQSPVLRLGPGDLFATYDRCFEQLWSTSAPIALTR
jgi:hypothetical protein